MNDQLTLNQCEEVIRFITESEKFKRLGVATVQERKHTAISNLDKERVEESRIDKQRRIAVRKKDEVQFEDQLEVKAQTMRVTLKLWLEDEVK